MKFKIQNILVLLCIGTASTVFGQKKNEDIGTEVVNVVKPYTPTISDAFKVKETPQLEDSVTTKKEIIKYNIFSFPVASTFTPSKGRAAAVDKTPRPRLFQNYATLGVGNYLNLIGELYVVQEVGDNGFVGGSFRHFSSRGGIKEAVLDDKFSNTALDLTYGSNVDNLSFNIDAGYQHQIYNWYGLYVDEPFFDTNLFNSIDPQQTYHNAYVGGRLEMTESFFKGATLKYNRFWDAYDSAENRFIFKPQFDFDIAETSVKTDLIVDYVGGEFDRPYLGGVTDASLKYGFANFGIHPSFVVNRDEWTVNIGAAAFYSMNTEQSEGKFFVYPEVTATFKVVGDLMVLYLGAEGGLDQNSYRDFTNVNPFVSPTLAIAPTNRQFEFYGGLKGKLANSVSYNVRGFFKSEKDKAMFLLNRFPAADGNPDLGGYEYGNSFGLVYDNVKTIGGYGEIIADFSKNVSLGLNATFQTYDTEFSEEAWNLPQVRVGANLDVDITKKWYAGADVFYVGERKDVLNFTEVLGGTTEIATLKGYFDANAHVGYQHNERLSGFLKLNNIANQKYEKWLNTPVQGFQVMLGANYKFDF
ncbi:TonB-dependent receptor [Flavobacterium sp.]|uniref:TonB-dependent receptor n=1 Tax=Flavobacterium sp. TaxID=239 RepID=UPI0012298095|nr:TonB-dependent receptor [Flavobacterium sp.]RZJ69428.1 MAG: TonB-dependent receptor [Flavobacterium sp.]